MEKDTIYVALDDSKRKACHVIAPALTPRRPSQRIKTNRRDARKLVGLLRRS